MNNGKQQGRGTGNSGDGGSYETFGGIVIDLSESSSANGNLGSIGDPASNGSGALPWIDAPESFFVCDWDFESVWQGAGTETNPYTLSDGEHREDEPISIQAEEDDEIYIDEGRDQCVDDEETNTQETDTVGVFERTYSSFGISSTGIFGDGGFRRVILPPDNRTLEETRAAEASEKLVYIIL